MIHQISETIPPEPDVFQLESNPDLVTFLPKHLHLEVERLKFVPILVAPQYIVAIESPISCIQPLEIYFGPDDEILPPGLISIEEIPQDETLLTPTHFGVDLYLYESFHQSPTSAFFDPVSIRVPVDPIVYTFGRITMPKPTSSIGPSILVATKPTLATLSMFTTSPESHLYGGPSVPPGYQYLSRTFSGASLNPWSSPMSLSGILSSSSLVSTKQIDPLFTSSVQYQVGSISYSPWRLVIPHKLPSHIPKFQGNPGEDPPMDVITYHFWCS